MKRKIGLAILFIPALVPAAVTLDFSELHGADGCSFSALDSQGFHVEGTFGVWHESHTFIPGDPALQAVGFGDYSFARFTRLDGGQFRFLGLDVSSNAAPFGQIEILGHSGGWVSFQQALMVQSADRYEGLTSDRPDLWLDDMYVQLFPTPTSGSMNFDNVRLETVPEPCSVALSGLVSVLAMRQRKRG
ncbi:MAG: hypothetical protein JSS65_03855 [Armatimonadetes bacterium]|nr:hypothetical protein [Armatimonadota bacterium]